MWTMRTGRAAAWKELGGTATMTPLYLGSPLRLAVTPLGKILNTLPFIFYTFGIIMCNSFSQNKVFAERHLAVAVTLFLTS